jgi:hypothetical protein
LFPPEPIPVVPLGAVLAASAAANPLAERTELVPVGCLTCPAPVGGTVDGTLPGLPGLLAEVPAAPEGCPGWCDNGCGRFLYGLYRCICCPDPCYEPHWVPLADAAFIVEAARPVTQQRLRWDSGQNLILPDRSEYFWARADGRNKGPRPPAGALAEQSLRSNDLSLYTEAASARASVFVELPYRSISPAVDPSTSGFADMNVGGKALLFDCELLQLAFQLRAYLPTGNFTKGIGNGHVSLEPSLLLGVKLSPSTYFQGQLAEWVPLGGDPDYQGAILHYHASVNQVVYRILPDVPLVATLEGNGWSFQHGAYTDPVLGPFQKSSGETYATLGGGLRLFVCDRIDFGVGAAFALTERSFARELYRVEFRWRY